MAYQLATVDLIDRLETRSRFFQYSKSRRSAPEVFSCGFAARVESGCGRRSSWSHASNNRWYPGQRVTTKTWQKPEIALEKSLAPRVRVAQQALRKYMGARKNGPARARETREGRGSACVSPSFAPVLSRAHLFPSACVAGYSHYLASGSCKRQIQVFIYEKISNE